MKKGEARERIRELRDELERHNHAYYVLSQPVINDFEYDIIMQELKELERRFPEFTTPDSPSLRVGSDLNEDFIKVEHTSPMLSLGNTYSIEDLGEFDNRVRKVIGDDFEYVCELKYDGTAISLTYTSGKLERAVTRGDGTRGDDVTRNVRTIRSVPQVLKGSGYPTKFEIRGEIIFPGKEFRELNEQRVARGEEPLANPRNASSGTIKMKNPAEVAKRPLDCQFYFIKGEGLPYSSHFENMKAARNWGFKVSSEMEKHSKLDGVIGFIEKWDSERKTLPFDIDGIVFKVDSYELQNRLGFTAKEPRWAISYKFEAEQANTRLNDVIYQIGRTGSITPVAVLEPVLLAGTIVKRASLHNADQIELLDLHRGDHVYVEKGGEIIPKIVGVDLSNRKEDGKRLQFIEICPECGTPLVRKEGEANHYCPNSTGCPPQIKGRIEHFISRKAMNIDGLGEETIELLYNEGLVSNAADLYELSTEQLAQLERLGEKSAQNIIYGLNMSREVPFSRVLFALGIRHVGETVAKILAKHFGSVEKLAGAGVEELVEVEEIGDIIAKSLIRYFGDKDNQLLIDRLRRHGISTEAGQDAGRGTKLEGLSFVISGTFKAFSRDKLKAIIEDKGGKILSAVSSKTSCLVSGEGTGPSKLSKAQKYDIKIITEEELLKMLHD